MASDINIVLRFEKSNLYYLGNYMHVAFNNHFGCHGNLQTASMASDINFDLGFEISNLYYPGKRVHVAFTTLVTSEAMATSRQPQWPHVSILTSDLK